MRPATLFAFFTLFLCNTAVGKPRSATVPITLDHNRMIVDVEFVRTDGTVRAARAWVDTGNQYLVLADPLARDLGFEVPALQAGGRPAELSSPSRPLRLGGLALDVEGVTVQVLGGARVPGTPAEANLPASVLRRYHAVFDYPSRLLTLAPPGTVEPRGVGVPCGVNADTGLFLIDATVDGDTVALGVDNGSAGTWVSETLTAEWRKRYPDWPQAIGAVGSTNFFGFPLEREGVLMRLPELEIGGLHAREVAVLGLGQWMFDWYSQKSAGPVSGFIGANVLAGFRLEVDFENHMTYWEPGPAAPANDTDIVGLTLRPEADGSFTVAGVVTRGGEPIVEGVEPGDKLVRVDGLDTANATMGAVVGALRGKPGSAHTLVIERDGKRLTLEAMVTRLP